MDITELELVMIISPHGDVSTIKIVRDKKTGNCKGYAFVEMVDKDGAERAVARLPGGLGEGLPCARARRKPFA